MASAVMLRFLLLLIGTEQCIGQCSQSTLSGCYANECYGTNANNVFTVDGAATFVTTFNLCQTSSGCRACMDDCDKACNDDSGANNSPATATNNGARPAVTNTGGGCFSSSSHVTLSTGSQKSISSLSLGDKVMTLSPSGQEIVTPFLGWIHKDSRVPSNFIKLLTSSQAMVTLTPEHIIMVHKQGDTMPRMQPAHMVEEGDDLVTKDLKKDKVVSISSEESEGLFAPLTSTGTLLVDGLLVSCYAHTYSHHMAHAWFTPARWIHGLLDTEQTQQQDGMRLYSSLGIKVAQTLGLYYNNNNQVPAIPEEPVCLPSNHMDVFWQHVGATKVL